MVLLALLWLLVFDVPTGKYFEKCGLDFQKSSILGLLKACFPLFLASFLMMYISNAPKFAVDAYLSDEYQTYYGILFMPASVINLFSLFAFRPLLTKLTAMWNEKRRKAFLLTVGKLILWILFVTAAAFLWTPNGETYVFGLQTRYMIPVLPMILLLLRVPAVSCRKDITDFLTVTAVLANAWYIVDALNVTLLT